MRIVRIYQPGTYAEGDLVPLSTTATQHVSIVLKMPVGAHITLFNGNNIEYDSIIHTVEKKKVLVQIMSSATIHRESPKPIHLAQAISKGERMELVVQKAVELGVTSITPILSERCVVKMDAERMNKKQTQWQAIAVSACEQCGRNQIPTIHLPTTLHTFLKACTTPVKLILHPFATLSLRTMACDLSATTLLIGPEGGFSDTEITLSMAHGFQALRLGPRTLRTETAAISALSVLQALAGDL